MENKIYQFARLAFIHNEFRLYDFEMSSLFFVFFSVL